MTKRGASDDTSARHERRRSEYGAVTSDVAGAVTPESAPVILLIGAGAAGNTHLRVLEQIPGLAVVAAVDTQKSRSATFRNGGLPLYRTVRDAAKKHSPSIVVIATPTPTHARVCDEVAEVLPSATILVEKPMADNFADARRLLSSTDGRRPVNVALHMAFAPEVTWGASIVSNDSDLGVPVAIQSWAADPYQTDLASAESRLCTSWIDSGINALSVIERFGKVVERKSLHRLSGESLSTFEGVFRCETEANQFEAHIMTSWNVTDATRSTRVRYSSGAELVMDHHAVAGYLMAHGRVVDMFGSDGSTQRRASHYLALYRWWLVAGNQVFSPKATLRLHSMLLEGIDQI